MKRNYYILFAFVGLSLFNISCKKYLEAKSNDKLSVPATLEDVQAILDTYITTNQAQIGINTSADEYYLSNEDWMSIYDQLNKDAYIWDPNTQNEYDWSTQYAAIYYANTALDNLVKISKAGQEKWWNELKGSALFLRAFAYAELIQTYTIPYNAATAKDELGLPLRLNSNFNEISERASLQDTYNRVVTDLKEALLLLPESALYKTRPSKPAAFALLARMHLIMGNYRQTKLYADSSLQLYNVLIDYNSLSATAANPMKRFNDEVLYYTNTGSPNNSNSTIAKIDSVLYNMFEPGDLRKQIFFKNNQDGSVAFKASYNGSISRVFNGLATDELYLVRAEANARENDLAAALHDLNFLLQNRWKSGSFVPIADVEAEELIRLILKERRKELIYRGTRWMDLRRLNKDPRFKTELIRTINGTTYKLAPDDLRYAFLIPATVINTTGMRQNKR